MPYRVLIVVKDQWYSDQKPFATYLAALRHRKQVAQKWNTGDTAIAAPDNRVLAFQESLDYRRELAKLKSEA